MRSRVASEAEVEPQAVLYLLDGPVDSRPNTVRDKEFSVRRNDPDWAAVEAVEAEQAVVVMVGYPN